MSATSTSRRRPLHLRPPSSIQEGAVIVTIKDGCVLAGKRRKQPYIAEYALPGGKSNRGEYKHQIAERDLKQKTGLALDDLTYLGHIREILDHDSIFTHWIFAGTTTLEPQNLEPGKCEGWEWLTITPSDHKLSNMILAHRAAINMHLGLIPREYEFSSRLPFERDLDDLPESQF